MSKLDNLIILDFINFILKYKIKWCYDNDIKEAIIKYNEDVTARLHQEGVM